METRESKAVTVCRVRCCDCPKFRRHNYAWGYCTDGRCYGEREALQECVMSFNVIGGEK